MQPETDMLGDALTDPLASPRAQIIAEIVIHVHLLPQRRLRVVLWLVRLLGSRR